MKDKISIIGNGGIGDCILSLKCAAAANRAGHIVDNYMFVRDEVFEPLYHLFHYDFNLIQCPEETSEENSIRHDENVLANFKKKYGITKDLYFAAPDSLFSGKLAFDYARFNTRPQAVKNSRILERFWRPKDVIYCALNSSTPAYQLHGRTKTIIEQVARQNPNKQVYFNNITSWNGTLINNGDFSTLPQNVVYFENQNFDESLQWLNRSEYCICVDNGISHIAYELGMPRLLLDTRLGFYNMLFRSRWRYNLDESIPVHSDSISIGKLIHLNLSIPQTTLIDRLTVIENLEVDWTKNLNIKGY